MKVVDTLLLVHASISNEPRGMNSGILKAKQTILVFHPFLDWLYLGSDIVHY